MHRGYPAVGPERQGAGFDASGVQNLPDGERRHGDPELRQLVLDPVMAPQRILPRVIRQRHKAS